MELLQEKIENSKKESNPTFYDLCLNNFSYFFFFGFCIAIQRVDGKYITPLHLKETSDRLQSHKRTSTVAPRFHLKSTIVEAYVAWKLLRMEHFWNEWLYMSYTSDLGAYHTKRLKRYIHALPELFGECRNLTDSESILYYSRKGRYFYCEPIGVLTFQRGKHPTGMILDDILKDPQVKLDISQLEKITKTFFEEIEQMPKEELHIVGTPQDQEDLFAKLEGIEIYDCKRYDAEINSEKGIAWWQNNPEFNWASLKIKEQTIGHKAYMKEFRCTPVRGMEGFIGLNELNAIIKRKLKNYDLIRDVKLNKRDVIAGFDIGKKTHPSHLCVLTERNRELVQIHSKFMDGWNYIDQIAYLQEAIKKFGIDKLYYDNTRAEFEITFEAGDLPSEMEGIAFTAKTKFGMATELDKVITNKKIQLLADERQKRQILTVDCDLQAPETDDGHGDAFFSLCLAVLAWSDNKGQIAWLA